MEHLPLQALHERVVAEAAPLLRHTPPEGRQALSQRPYPAVHRAPVQQPQHERLGLAAGAAAVVPLDAL